MAVFTEGRTCKHGHLVAGSGPCLVCRRASRALWRKANPRYARSWQVANLEKSRDQARKSIYGLSAEEIRVLFLSQNRRCAVCERPGHTGARGTGQPHEVQLVIEHCHTSGVVRGLVCQRCNILISNHTSKMLRRAADFVAAHESE